MSDKKPISIAVIGAGISGLAATKEFIEQGFRVTTFERYDAVGGLWSYRPDPSQRSVGWHTMVNSSKYMVNPPFSVITNIQYCFSDFPMPDGTC
jgi:dimethylaniline monooxygenase (N-oxide forming)